MRVRESTFAASTRGRRRTRRYARPGTSSSRSERARVGGRRPRRTDPHPADRAPGRARTGMGLREVRPSRDGHLEPRLGRGARARAARRRGRRHRRGVPPRRRRAAGGAGRPGNARRRAGEGRDAGARGNAVEHSARRRRFADGRGGRARRRRYRVAAGPAVPGLRGLHGCGAGRARRGGPARPDGPAARLASTQRDREVRRAPPGTGPDAPSGALPDARLLHDAGRDGRRGRRARALGVGPHRGQQRLGARRGRAHAAARVRREPRSPGCLRPADGAAGRGHRAGGPGRRRERGRRHGHHVQRGRRAPGRRPPRRAAATRRRRGVRRGREGQGRRRTGPRDRPPDGPPPRRRPPAVVQVPVRARRVRGTGRLGDAVSRSAAPAAGAVPAVRRDRVLLPLQGAHGPAVGRRCATSSRG